MNDALLCRLIPRSRLSRRHCLEASWASLIISLHPWPSSQQRAPKMAGQASHGWWRWWLYPRAPSWPAAALTGSAPGVKWAPRTAGGREATTCPIL